MRAAVLDKLNVDLVVRDIPDPVPAKAQVRVRLHAAALNHRDSFIRQGMYARIKLPAVVGSDGAGEVEQVGEGVSTEWIGKRVVLIPCHDWGSEPRVQGRDFVMLGMPEQGTLAERIVQPADRLVEIPAHLSWAEAAALPLAGLTAYRALVARGELKKGEHVLITGIGGGVASLAQLFAQALGAQVSVTSGSEEKLARARAAGAIAAVNYKDADWGKKLVEIAGRPPSLIIDSTGGAQVNALVNVAAGGGRIVFYGATVGKTDQLDLPRIFFKQLDLRGSTMGNDDDFRGMMGLVAREKLKPPVDVVLPLDKINEAIARMDAGAQQGKIVLDLG